MVLDLGIWMSHSSGIWWYGVALLVGSIKLQVSFAKEPYKRDDSAKEAYNFIDPTDRSHPIVEYHIWYMNESRHEV